MSDLEKRVAEVLTEWEQVKAEYIRPNSLISEPELYTCAFDLAALVKNLQFQLDEAKADIKIWKNTDEVSRKREEKLVEALRFYADDAHWKHIYSSGSALPSDRFKLWERAQTTLCELGIEEGVC